MEKVRSGLLKKIPVKYHVKHYGINTDGLDATPADAADKYTECKCWLVQDIDAHCVIQGGPKEFVVRWYDPYKAKREPWRKISEELISKYLQTSRRNSRTLSGGTTEQA